MTHATDHETIAAMLDATEGDEQEFRQQMRAAFPDVNVDAAIDYTLNANRDGNQEWITFGLARRIDDQRRMKQYRDRWAAARREAAEIGRYYVACKTVGVKTHAASSTIVANGGFTFPRPMCAVSASSTRAYATVLADQTAEITCKRCLASIAKRNARHAH